MEDAYSGQNILPLCGDHLKAIEIFQLTNGLVAFPSISPLLPLLDLHMIPRYDLHTSLLEKLRDTLIEQINNLDTKLNSNEKELKLKELLNKTFGLVRIKQIQPVVMAIFKNMKQVDEKFLRIIVRDIELYAACDVKVKRQIWVNDQSLFGDEVSPELSIYIREKDNIFFDDLNMENLFFSILPKMRRQTDVVQRLVHMIGTSVQLYDMILQFLRTLFLRTRNIHYCTLRVELLMAIHDLDIQEITSLDPCHKFTWCLDACIRDGEVNEFRLRELHGFIEKIKRGQQHILGDISMILCDPYAINFFANSVIKMLAQLYNFNELPRSNSIFVILIRMLSLGLSSCTIIENQTFKEPKFDTKILTKFLPAIMSLFVDDQARIFHSKLSLEEQNAISIDQESPVPVFIGLYIQENHVAAVLVLYYALYVAKHQDRFALMRILPVLSLCKDNCAYEDSFLHTFIASLIHMADEFSHDQFCTAVFDEFLFLGLTNASVSVHIMKLLWHVHDNIKRIRLNALMKAIEPEHMDELYSGLLKKIETAQEIEQIEQD